MRKSVIVIAVSVILLIMGLLYFFVFDNDEIPEKENIDANVEEDMQVLDNISEYPQNQTEEGLVIQCLNEEVFKGNNFVDLSVYLSEVGNLEKGTIALSFKFDSILGSQTIMPIFYLGKNSESDADNIFIIEIGHSGGSGGPGSGSDPDPSNTMLYTTWIKNNQKPFLCFDSNENLNENTWYDFAVVVNETGNTGYLNGQEITTRHYNFGDASNTSFLNSIPNQEVLWLGRGMSSSMISPNFVNFKGSIKNLRIYNKSLSSSKIQELS